MCMSIASWTYASTTLFQQDLHANTHCCKNDASMHMIAWNLICMRKSTSLSTISNLLGAILVLNHFKTFVSSAPMLLSVARTHHCQCNLSTDFSISKNEPVSFMRNRSLSLILMPLVLLASFQLVPLATFSL